MYSLPYIFYLSVLTNHVTLVCFSSYCKHCVSFPECPSLVWMTKQHILSPWGIFLVWCSGKEGAIRTNPLTVTALYVLHWLQTPVRVKALQISLHLSRNKVPFDLSKSNLILFVSKIGHYSLKEIKGNSAKWPWIWYCNCWRICFCLHCIFCYNDWSLVSQAGITQNLLGTNNSFG